MNREMPNRDADNPVHNTESERPQTDRHEEVVTLEAGTGMERVVRLTNKEKIGEGAFAKTYRADVMFPTDDAEKIGEVRARLVVKEFKKGERNAEKAVVIQEALRKAGVRTWGTYRAVQGRDAVAMTDGKRKGDLLVSCSDASRDKESFREQKANRMLFSEKMIRLAIRDAVFAGKAGIIIPPDAWFTELKALPELKRRFPLPFRHDDKGVSAEEIFVGDYDNIEIPRQLVFQDSGDGTSHRQYLSELVKDPLRTARLNLLSLKSGFDDTVDQVARRRTAKSLLRSVGKLIGEEARRIDEALGQTGKWDQMLSMLNKPSYVGSDPGDFDTHRQFREE
jgi:hypothetical protein